MFKLTAATVLALLNATFAASLGERAALLPAVSNGALAPNAISIVETCNDANLAGACNAWSSTVLPSGCGDLAGAGQDNTVTSVPLPPTGVLNVHLSGAGCTGRSQLVVGTVNNLATVGFDNVASSFSCAST
ncbi:hypothetical protein CPB85DRAFT_1348628 [Mucidula mucida]|nr:hypothetical protein CPB85DRAFT_1348628 [Mucidula mucida]